jgi:hypothetical protein
MKSEKVFGWEMVALIVAVTVIFGELAWRLF